MTKIKVRNTHLHLTDELRGNNLTNRCLTADVRVNGFYIKGWRGEVWLDVKYKTTRGLSKVEMCSGDEAFEIDVVLSKAPPTNVFAYELQTKGLDFHYQSALTQEEINSGSYRPDNVVGSYAVYHSTRRNNYQWANGIEKNYCTGKFCHIYRPQAIDANGDSIWCDLDIVEESGIMAVTVPQEFLDNAIYPVKIDPEFGYHADGATSYNHGDTKIYYNDHDNQCSNDVEGEVTALWFRGGLVNAGIPCNVQMYLYEKDEGTLANSPLRVTSNVNSTMAGTSPVWYEHSVSGTLTLGKRYMVALISEPQTGVSDSTISVQGDNTEDKSRASNIASQMVPPDPIGASIWHLTITHSTYAVYSLPVTTETSSVASNANIGLYVDPTHFKYAGPVAATSPVRSTNAFDIKLKHICNHKLSDGQFTLNTCPRCLGTGYYYDVKFNEMGRSIEVSLEDKLQQALEKLVLTKENKFHEDIAIDLKKWLGKTPISKIKAIIKYDLTEGIAALKNSQKSVSGLSPRAQIALINGITVTILDVDSLHYVVTLTTISGKVVNLKGIVSLSDIELTG